MSPVAIPFLLGSLWTLIPIGLAVIVYILRAELDGCTDYAAQVRYRLVPGVW